MILECPNCCNEEGLEISFPEKTLYKVILEKDKDEKGRTTYTLKEMGKEEVEEDPELFCPKCGETCDVPKEFWPPYNKVEYA